MFTSLARRIFDRHDAPVWAVVREPKYKVRPENHGNRPQPGGKVFDYNTELPYSLNEVADKANRSERSIVGSLRRLEKRGKVKDVHGGWQRKEK